ncbi:MAG TPA: glucoamylase family protein, partial [bacterium]|nr:glucoamylase family protein [bacterium]
MKSRILLLLLALLWGLPANGQVQPERTTSGAVEDSVFLDLLQRSAVNFFWVEANSSNGLIKDRSASWSACSIASVGFGLTAICIGIDRGWIPADKGRQRVLTTLKTLWSKPQGRDARGYCGYKGFYYHFLNMQTGLRDGTTELSDIDSALLLAGIIYSREYFSGEEPEAIEIRALADSIYHRTDWQWMRNYQPGLTTQWSPESGFGSGWWSGYNEMMIMYILGLGSPTHPLPVSVWKAWCGGYNWSTQYGQTYIIFPPLFGHQYSHCWIDFRGIQDDYMRN